MKIAIFTDNFLPGLGGLENAVHNFATALGSKHDVLVLAPSYKENGNDGALPYKVARAKSIRVTKNDYWAMPLISPKLRKTLKEFKPDVLHCHSLGMLAGLANRYGKKYGVPSVYTLHTKYGYCFRRALRVKLFSKIVLKYVVRRAKKADAICAVSHSMKEEAKRYGINRDITVIRNGGNVSEALEKQNSDKFEFLFVGLVIEYKNIGFTLSALAKVKEVRDDFIFRVVGRGPDEKKFIKQAKELGLENNVEFVGAVSDREALNGYYARANLFLFPSIFDTDGLVILEAANENTASVVLRGAGASERITDGVNGFISEQGTQAYAEKLLYLMENKDEILAVGKRAKEIILPWASTADEYEKIYEKLISNNVGKEKL